MQKQFYYTSEDYLKRKYKEIYSRVSRWKRIYYNTAGNPYFMQDGKRHLIENYTLTDYPNGTQTEVKAADGESVILAAHQNEVYYKPYFIELDEGGEKVRVYQYERTETE